MIAIALLLSLLLNAALLLLSLRLRRQRDAETRRADMPADQIDPDWTKEETDRITRSAQKAVR